MMTKDHATTGSDRPGGGSESRPLSGSRCYKRLAIGLGLQLLVAGGLSGASRAHAVPSVLDISRGENADTSPIAERRDMPGTVRVLSAQVAAKTTEEGASVTVGAPWARATIGASRPGAAYLTVSNDGDASVVLEGVDVDADVANRASFHRTETDDAGTSRMQPVGELTIGARASIAFEPGGDHVMLDGLREPLVEGQSVALTLRFSDGTELEIDVPVLAVTARGPQEESR